MPKIDCDQCQKLKERKQYKWYYKDKVGIMDLCEDCVEEYKQNGYRLVRE